MARKPDVFEQMVELESYYLDGRMMLDQDTATKLLRRYHARVRRMVAIYAKTYPVAEEMLRNLDRIKKGTL